MNLHRVLVLLLLCLIAPASAAAQEDTYNGSQLWLRYVPVNDAERYRATVADVVVENATANPVYRHTPTLAVEAGGTERLVGRASRPPARSSRAGSPACSGRRFRWPRRRARARWWSARATALQRSRRRFPLPILVASEGYVIRSVGSRTIIAGRRSSARCTARSRSCGSSRPGSRSPR